MKGLEAGHDKVKKICDLLKRETLDPAQKEAEEIVQKARHKAEELLKEAEQKIAEMQTAAEKQMQEKKAVFETSLAQACRQTMDTLKDQIEQKLFNPSLSQILAKPLQETTVVARLIEAVIEAVEKEGLGSNLSAAISSAVRAEEVNRLLAQKSLERLREKGVLLTALGGGVQLKVVDHHMTLDLSDAAFKELVGGYVRKEFRELIFGK